MHPSIWLPEPVLPGFRDFMARFYWTRDEAAKKIFSALALALNLLAEDTKHLSDLHTGHDNQLRLLHYPSIEFGANQRHRHGHQRFGENVRGRMPAHQD